ncbi:MAG TPA: acetyl-CoA carboxylase biotin carboxyl carrier protein subunit [Trebonia sp.]|nr:acetyl-CoA carboxylase biotin carboxyl carrier protein subunit [Trebonia sp.]
MELTNEDVADILALLDSLPYDQLDLRTSSFRLTLRREPGGWTQARQETSEPEVVSVPDAGDVVPATGSQEPGPVAPGTAGLLDVTAPLPGTFYRAPRPGAAPFAEVGQSVEPETVVAIVETMKLMNPVHAGTRGIVAEILAANAQAVTQGATLLRVRPS